MGFMQRWNKNIDPFPLKFIANPHLVTSTRLDGVPPWLILNPSCRKTRRSQLSSLRAAHGFAL
jgi:hypothetical protein